MLDLSKAGTAALIFELRKRRAPDLCYVTFDELVDAIAARCDALVVIAQVTRMGAADKQRSAMLSRRFGGDTLCAGLVFRLEATMRAEEAAAPSDAPEGHDPGAYGGPESDEGGANE